MSAASPIIVNAVESTRADDIRARLKSLHSRRLLLQSIARGALAASCALGLLLIFSFLDYARPLPRPVRAAVLFTTLAAAAVLLVRAATSLLRRRGMVEVAREVEGATGSRRNTLVTLVESLEREDVSGGRLYILSRLEERAREELSEVDEDEVAPTKGARRGAVLLASATLLLLFLRLAFPAAFAREAGRVLLLAADQTRDTRAVRGGSQNGAAAGEVAPSIQEVRVRVVAPAYSGLGAEEVEGDAPVRALAGSQVQVTLVAAGRVEGASLSFNGDATLMRPSGGGQFYGAFTAEASGAFEARLAAGEGFAPGGVVRAVEVYNDAAPEARITEPLGDQVLRSLPGGPVNVRWTATDDLGVAGVALKYIKSRGEGDAAKFTNGEVGAGAAGAAGARELRGSASLDLRRLDVQPGDTLVFWLEARDRKPGAPNVGRSASLAIAFARAELAKLDLSDLMPNEIGRFLLSQRQIILHTEKLHAERRRLAADELKRRSNDIAAEQRDFKNSFSGYIKMEGGGEEESEPGASIEERVRAAEDERTAPHFHGIPEPPAGAPTSVMEMTYAIRAMWDAEDALTNADTALALKHEREALQHLKRAQASVRYVPPILPRSQPIDLKRRYAGELEEIKTRLERVARGHESRESAAARAALSDAYAALKELQEALGGAAGARATALGRARERARQGAERLMAAAGGDHAATIAEAAGQLRVVESELSRTDAAGTAEEFAARASKPMALLTQSASSLFAIVENSTRAAAGEANPRLPSRESRAADYFRRLAGGGR